ncbi:unnamed protein product [Lactuca saligna]|uniref:Uncharacterized protein n=1 Tax=Lactuca saligna TaxID=75948 RepID=A0AA35Z605_LACSI|nr:unnamed protein product [Lactuca saligna]
MSKKRKESKKQAKGSTLKPKQVDKVVKATLKKVVKFDQPSKKIQNTFVEESSSPVNQVMHLKSGILKHLKKMAHRPCHSPERSTSFSPKDVLQISHKCRGSLFNIGNRIRRNCVKAQSSSFDQELKELKAVAKEKHLLYVHTVKKVREYVNLKLEELRFAVLESTLKAVLAPLANLLNLIPTNAPYVQTGGARGRRNWCWHWGDNYSTHTSLRKISTITTSTTTTTKPIAKGIVIGTAGGGLSSSKPPPSTEEIQNKGKGIFTEPTVEEKKVAIEKEMEKQ